MALPANGIAWPPKELANVLPVLRTYGAWYSNETATLSSIYAQSASRPGLLQRIRTWFVGAKATESPDMANIHISLAQEICRTSANLLFSEPATAVIDAAEDDAEEKVSKAQERLDLITGPEFEQTIVSGAEISAALGGVFLRVTWDKATAEHVFISKVDADMAWPTFHWGRLHTVTFWRTVKTEGQQITRHLEHHWKDNTGVGMVSHGLYEGTPDNLGHRVPFDAHDSTAWLAEPANAELLINGDTLSTLTPGLAVEYAPNITPSALWRNDPVGAHLGRSDLEGIEQKLDALDELYSSWLRDIRLGKGRLIVGESMLQDLGAGKGAGFDLDQSIFTPVKAAPSSMGDSKMAIEKVQFEIRTDDFLTAIDHFRRIILTAAGYSPATFGMQDSSGAAVTATEVAAKAQTSYTTRKRKILGLKPAMERILTKALAVDAQIFPAGVTPCPVRVDFADGIADDAEAVARQNQLDYSSQSASIEERVKRRNPSWDQPEVDEEVARIRADFALEPLTDPTTFGEDGQGLDPSLTPTG
ncbi:A118 family predicted phage portal protein [Arthrobacter sp. SLBN-83]|uniref:phage portal protein n=1 Tax=Arthrobacter sp. SLBN-83 TaxID=2768449 RepID=UPI0011519FBA|nr:phage portal protein [Arthrobacter sp. SLBN-83]TQJ60489.1 A118 family predicted phage portal protein [Arthrobacter sp. SLBN-83]